MTLVQKVGHRRRGSGASTVRVVAPDPPTSGRLFIGRRLWQLLGEPARVSLQRQGARVAITPGDGDDFAVSGAASNSIPRLSLGQAALEQLGLDPGVYPGQIEQGGFGGVTLYIAVDREPETREERDGATRAVMPLPTTRAVPALPRSSAASPVSSTWPPCSTTPPASGPALRWPSALGSPGGALTGT